MALTVAGNPVYAVTHPAGAVTVVTVNGTAVLAPPTMVTQPVGATVIGAITHPMTLAGASLGGDLNYQWRVGGVNTGANLPTHTHPASPPATYNYDCILTNGMGAVTSAIAAVVVVPTTHIITAETYGVFESIGYGPNQGVMTPLTVPGRPAWTWRLWYHAGPLSGTPNVLCRFTHNGDTTNPPANATIVTADGETFVIPFTGTDGTTINYTIPVGAEATRCYNYFKRNEDVAVGIILNSMA